MVWYFIIFYLVPVTNAFKFAIINWLTQKRCINKDLDELLIQTAVFKSFLKFAFKIINFLGVNNWKKTLNIILCVRNIILLKKQVKLLWV